jgi:hypothetical protein
MPESVANCPPLIGVDPTEFVGRIGRFSMKSLNGKNLDGLKTRFMGRVER